MLQNAPGNAGVENGNTNLSTPNETASKAWCFTLNNPKPEDINNLCAFCSAHCEIWVFQKEKGNETGTEHLQGFIKLKSKNRFSWLKKHGASGAHWEKCRNEKASIDYCMKSETALGEFWGNIKKPDVLRTITELYEWQQEIVDIIKAPIDDRKIYWFWEKKGNIGKTALCKFLSHHYGAIPLEGKKNDILAFASAHPSNCYVWDISRSNEMFVSYDAIEKIKNGYYMSGKYEGAFVNTNPPHLIIFANFPPKQSALSDDRWVIKCLQEVEEVEEGDYDNIYNDVRFIVE